MPKAKRHTLQSMFRKRLDGENAKAWSKKLGPMDGEQLAGVSPAQMLRLFLDFYGDVEFVGRSQDGFGDLLLVQINDDRVSRDQKTVTLNFTRQLYGGAGKSQQLGVDYRRSAATLPPNTRRKLAKSRCLFELWSNKAPSLAEFEVACQTAIDALGAWRPPYRFELYLARF